MKPLELQKQEDANVQLDVQEQYVMMKNVRKQELYVVEVFI